MHKFKVGDVVAFNGTIDSDASRRHPKGTVGKVARVGTEWVVLDVEIAGALPLRTGGVWDTELDLVREIKTKEETMSKIFNELADESTKALFEAGFIGANLELTAKGSEQLMALIFADHKEGMVKAAKEEIKAIKSSLK